MDDLLRGATPIGVRAQPGDDSSSQPVPVEYRLALAALDALDSNAVVLDEAGTIRVANARWYGFARENGGGPGCGSGNDYLEATRRGAAAGAPGATELLAALDRILAGSDEPFELQYPCDAPTRPRWFLVRLAPFRLDGRTAVLVTHQDVTSRRVSRATLDKLEIVARGTSSGVAITDADARVAWVNEAFTRITGWPLSTLMGRALADCVDTLASDGPGEQRIRDALANRSSAECALLCRRADGRSFWSGLRLDPVFDDGGALEGFVLLQTDITGRKSAEVENVTAHLDEREHVAGSLHEGLGQELAAAQFMLGALAARSAGERDPALLERASEALRNATRTARTLAYATAPLRYARGIGPALRELSAEAEAAGLLEVECRVDPALATLADHRADRMYRIARRALARARGRDARTRIAIALDRSSPGITLRICDSSMHPDSEPARRELLRIQHLAESAGGYFEARGEHDGAVTITCGFPEAGTAQER